MVRFKKPNAILFNVEGTSTSIRFRNEILTPFIKENLETCLRETWNEQETNDCVIFLRNKFIDDYINGDLEVPPIYEEHYSRDEIISSIIKNVNYHMRQIPAKIPMPTPTATTMARQKQNQHIFHQNLHQQLQQQSNEVKAIYLLVWLYGYRNDLLKGHIYPDVNQALKYWKNELGIKLFTYATIDIMVQKMLLSCSLYGNLVPYIDGFFNYENVGKKNDAETYRNISRLIQIPSNQIIFISDNIQELKVCSSVGIVPVLIIRSHNKFLSDAKTPFKTIKSFTDLEFC